MKLYLQKKACSAVTYLAALIPVVLLGLFLIASLRLVSTQNYASSRGQAWNVSLVVAESGVEEALAHLNKTDSTNLAMNGWTRNGNIYTKRTYLGSNTYYDATIDYSNPANPGITSIGSVPPGLNTAR